MKALHRTLMALLAAVVLAWCALIGCATFRGIVWLGKMAAHLLGAPASPWSAILLLFIALGVAAFTCMWEHAKEERLRSQDWARYISNLPEETYHG